MLETSRFVVYKLDIAEVSNTNVIFINEECMTNCPVTARFPFELYIR